MSVPSVDQQVPRWYDARIGEFLPAEQRFSQASGSQLRTLRTAHRCAAKESDRPAQAVTLHFTRGASVYGALSPPRERSFRPHGAMPLRAQRLRWLHWPRTMEAEALDLAKHPRVEPLVRPRGESQRARLLVAAFDVAGDRGISRTAVTEIVKAAGVSRGTFYEHFSSKEDCFIHAYRFASDLLLEVVLDANREAEGDWRARLRAGVRAFLCALAFSPRFARAGLLEIQNAGEIGHAERHATLARFAEAYKMLFEQARHEDARSEVPTDDALFVLASGTEQLLCGYVRAGHVEELPQLEQPLVTVAESLLRGTADGSGGVSASGRAGSQTRASAGGHKRSRAPRRVPRDERNPKQGR